MENSKCAGIIGHIFGHKYKTIYSTKVNKPSAEEAKQLINLISNANKFSDLNDNIECIIKKRSGTEK